MVKTLLFTLLAAASASAASFTGLTFHGTTAAGVDVPAGARWNTLGGGTPIPNIYLFNSAATALNSGDGAAARINIPLAPGTYDYTWCFQPYAVGSATFWGVDLFFDGNDAQPLISAVVPDMSLAIAANGNPTFALNGVTGAPGANTLSAIIGNLKIQLSYAWVDNNPGIKDKVGLYNNIPDGALDCGLDGLGMRISVTEMPEPAVWPICVGAIGLMAWIRRAGIISRALRIDTGRSSCDTKVIHGVCRHGRGWRDQAGRNRSL